MTCELVAIRPARLDDLIQDPSGASDILFPPEGTKPLTRVDLDKAWAGVDYLLAGETGETELLTKVVFGGQPLLEVSEDDFTEWSFGPPQYLTADEVTAAAKLLAGLDRQTVATRYDAAAMDKNGVYPSGWVERGEGPEWLLDTLDELTEFYRKASDKGLAVLQFLT